MGTDYAGMLGLTKGSDKARENKNSGGTVPKFKDGGTVEKKRSKHRMGGQVNELETNKVRTNRLAKGGQVREEHGFGDWVKGAWSAVAPTVMDAGKNYLQQKGGELAQKGLNYAKNRFFGENHSAGDGVCGVTYRPNHARGGAVSRQRKLIGGDINSIPPEYREQYKMEHAPAYKKGGQVREKHGVGKMVRGALDDAAAGKRIYNNYYAGRSNHARGGQVREEHGFGDFIKGIGRGIGNVAKGVGHVVTQTLPHVAGAVASHLLPFQEGGQVPGRHARGGRVSMPRPRQRHADGEGVSNGLSYDQFLNFLNENRHRFDPGYHPSAPQEEAAAQEAAAEGEPYAEEYAEQQMSAPEHEAYEEQEHAGEPMGGDFGDEGGYDLDSLYGPSDEPQAEPESYGEPEEESYGLDSLYGPEESYAEPEMSSAEPEHYDYSEGGGEMEPETGYGEPEAELAPTMPDYEEAYNPYGNHARGGAVSMPRSRQMRAKGGQVRPNSSTRHRYF